MELIQKIESDVKAAMKAGEKLRLQLLRTLRSVIKNAEITKRAVLNEADVLKVIATEVKKRKESIEAYVKAGRKELADQERQEADLLNAYLPEQLDDAAIDQLVARIATEQGITDSKQLGKLMGLVMKEVGAKSDGTKVRERVQKYFQNNT